MNFLYIYPNKDKIVNNQASLKARPKDIPTEQVVICKEEQPCIREQSYKKLQMQGLEYYNDISMVKEHQYIQEKKSVFVPLPPKY